MKSKIFAILLFNFLCVRAADEQFYLHDDFMVNLEFDDGVTLHSVDNDDDLLLYDIDGLEPIINCFDNVLMKDFIEKIIGKKLEDDATPLQNIVASINSWKYIQPEEFVDAFLLIKDISTSEMYKDLPELQFACHKITKFIINFINIPQNSQQAQFFVEQHADAWHDWVATMHQYL